MWKASFSMRTPPGHLQFWRSKLNSSSCLQAWASSWSVESSHHTLLRDPNPLGLQVQTWESSSMFVFPSPLRILGRWDFSPTSICKISVITVKIPAGLLSGT